MQGRGVLIFTGVTDSLIQKLKMSHCSLGKLIKKIRGIKENLFFCEEIRSNYEKRSERIRRNQRKKALQSINYAGNPG